LEYFVAAGVNDRCWLMEKEIDSNNLNLIRTTRCDFSNDDDGYLKVIRFSQDGRLMLTGGVDGKGRIWWIPEVRLLSTIDKGLKEIIDGDFDSKFEYSLLLSMDHLVVVELGINKAVVTSESLNKINNQSPNLVKSNEDLTKLRNVKLSLKPSVGFKFKCARFDPSNSNILYVTENCNNRNGSYLTVMNLSTCKREKGCRLPIKKNSTAMSISKDGKFLSIGYSDGSLVVLNTSSLKIYLCRYSIHPFPVTGLAIDLSTRNLISSSADGTILIHKIPSNPIFSLSNLFSFKASIIVVLVSIFFIFLFNIVSENPFNNPKKIINQPNSQQNRLKSKLDSIDYSEFMDFYGSDVIDPFKDKDEKNNKSTKL
jgi:WD40 repeat protein